MVRRRDSSGDTLSNDVRTTSGGTSYTFTVPVNAHAKECVPVMTRSSTKARIKLYKRQLSLPPPPSLLKPDDTAHTNAHLNYIMPPKPGIMVPMMSTAPEHIETVPAFDEPFHSSIIDDTIERMRLLDLERLERPGDAYDRIVYDSIAIMHNDNNNDNANNQCKVLPGELSPYYTIDDSSDETIEFESRFECGNLLRAIQVNAYVYELVLKPDVYTKSHVQWFYFRARNMQAGISYTFNLINYVKGDALFNAGMRPLVYSQRRADHDGVGWRRAGTNICYYQNSFMRARSNRPLFTLTFSFTPEHNNDTLFFAYSYPFSYTRLQRWLADLSSDEKRKLTFRRQELCRTLAGNVVDLLTITNFEEQSGMSTRKGVVITARVHPGESNASWMMKGFVDFLTGSTIKAQELRSQFVFKIVPMLNPDGVINGNYRCSLAGCDLNRMWSEPSKKYHAPIYYTKQILRRMSEDRELIMFVDLHGHSRKHNIFIYGCDNEDEPELRLRERTFPRMLWRTANNFSFDSCNFKVQKSKESTARVVIRREFSIINSFTLEASFCGADFGPNRGYHFHQQHFMDIGRSFCECLLNYCDPTQLHRKLAYEELHLLLPVKTNYRIVSDREEGGSEDNVDESSSRHKKNNSTSMKMNSLKNTSSSSIKKNDFATNTISNARKMPHIVSSSSSSINLLDSSSVESEILPVSMLMSISMSTIRPETTTASSKCEGRVKASSRPSRRVSAPPAAISIGCDSLKKVTSEKSATAKIASKTNPNSSKAKVCARAKKISSTTNLASKTSKARRKKSSVQSSRNSVCNIPSASLTQTKVKTQKLKSSSVIKTKASSKSLIYRKTRKKSSATEHVPRSASVGSVECRASMCDFFCAGESELRNMPLRRFSSTSRSSSSSPPISSLTRIPTVLICSPPMNKISADGLAPCDIDCGEVLFASATSSSAPPRSHRKKGSQRRRSRRTKSSIIASTSEPI